MRKIWNRAVALAAVAAFAVPSAAQAEIVYQFDFSNVVDNGGNPFAPNFSLTIRMPDYITATGLFALPAAIETPLSYDTTRAGTNKFGQFIFCEEPYCDIDDYGVGWIANSAFYFEPTVRQTDYWRAPGTYTGSLGGNDPYYFRGSALLTITDTSAVPEPASWALMIAGFGLVGAAIRRSRRVRVAYA